MKAQAACNSLKWITSTYLYSSPLHTCVHCESRTHQVVYIHVHYGVHGEMYMGIDSHLIDLPLCCIICSQIKKIRVLVAKPDVQIACHPNDRQSAACSPADHCDSTPWLENRPKKQTI